MRSAIAGAMLLYAGFTLAESPTPDAAPQSAAALLDEIAVTGSHIRAVDLETQHPILVIDRVEIERSGLTSLSDVVDLIVSNGPTANRNVNNGSNGEQLANLRSFGFNRTLVLLNGQRFVSDIQGAVDLSGIPLALVDRVEVLLDGASAIYGSDAITGVINIITRRNYEGGELAAYYGENSHGDGARDAFALTFGHKAESWSAAGGVEYTHDEPIFAGDRAISSVPYFDLPPGATGSTATPYAWLIPHSVANDCGFNGGNLGRCSLRLIDGRPGTSPDDFRRVDTTRDRFNFAPQNYLQTPQQRRAAFAQARWELSSKLAVSLEALFNQRESTQQLGPSNLQFNVLDAPSSDAFPIAADNLYNPFGEPVDFGRRRLVEAGSRYFHQTDDTRRLHLGVDGAFALWGRDFLWSADAIQTRSDTAESTGPYADNRKLALALGPSFRDAAGTAHCGTPQAPVDGCVPLDFFGPPGSITQPMLDYIDLFESNRSRDTTRNYGVHVSANDLVALPAGGVGFGAGLEYRHEAGAQLLDALDASGYANGNGETSASTRGAYSVREAYVEFDVPLLAERPLARSLNLSFGTRYSDYSNFGGTTNSQLGLRWRPAEDVLVRANYAQGFRAPAVLELYGGAVQQRNVFIDDPCDAYNGPSAAVRARCTALGVPANVDENFETGDATRAGNPKLEPETSRSRGAGFVWNPGWLPGFGASVDWYDVQLREAIFDPGYGPIVDNCYNRNSDRDCALISRDPATGAISHITDLLQNAPFGFETAGYDIDLNYRGETELGRFTMRWHTNYVDYIGELGRPRPGTELADGSLAYGNVVGQNLGGLFNTVWRWRSQLQLAWESGAWSASLTARYFSHIDENCNIVISTAAAVGEPALRSLCSDPDRLIVIANSEVPLNRVASVTFTDLQGSWDAPWHARVTLGVRNAFDRAPPVAYSAFSNSFFPDYDIPGRFWYLSYRQRF